MALNYGVSNVRIYKSLKSFGTPTILKEIIFTRIILTYADASVPESAISVGPTLTLMK